MFSNGLVTDSSWKCKESFIKPDDGWKQTNFSDKLWPNAFVRHDNSGLQSSTRVIGIPKSVHWISAENHRATRFICRRRISKEESLIKSSKSGFSIPDFNQLIKTYSQTTTLNG